MFLDGGKISSMGESTIVEIENGEIKILREGSISKEEIMKIFWVQDLIWPIRSIL